MLLNTDKTSRQCNLEFAGMHISQETADLLDANILSERNFPLVGWRV